MAPATMAPAKAEPKAMSDNTNQALEKPGATPAVITTPDEYKASLQKWNAQHFHVLTPAATFSGLPPQYGMVAALVQLNPDPNGGDVYQDALFCDKNKGEVAIAKIGLSKIAQAAGMTIKTERTDPRTIPNYWEVRATARFIGLDGRPQEVDATAEYDLRDDSPRVRKMQQSASRNNRDPRGQIEGARTYGLRGAEARAINAAIRQFGIKQKYTVDELKKPFVTVRVMWQPDRNDPEQMRMVAEANLRGTTTLYPAARELQPAPEHLDTIGADAANPRHVGSGSTAPAAEQPRSGDTTFPNGFGLIQKCEPPEEIKKRAGGSFKKWTVVDHAGVPHITTKPELAAKLQRCFDEKIAVDINSNENEYGENVIAEFYEHDPRQPSLLPDTDKL